MTTTAKQHDAILGLALALGCSADAVMAPSTWGDPIIVGRNGHISAVLGGFQVHDRDNATFFVDRAPDDAEAKALRAQLGIDAPRRRREIAAPISPPAEPFPARAAYLQRRSMEILSK